MTSVVRRQYDRAAGGYDRRWAGYVRRTLDLLDTCARDDPDERALDVGCGTGTFAERLVERNALQEVVGVDVSAGMLAEARRKLAAASHVRFVESHAEALPFKDDMFDVVVSASALHYVERPRAALAEAARVLRPGGRLVLLDWDRGRWWMALLDRLLRRFGLAHDRSFSADEVLAMVRGAGLRIRPAHRVRRAPWGFFVVLGDKP